MSVVEQDRVRARRWRAKGVELGQVVARLHEMQAELAELDAQRMEHPHPRNCVLNLVVVLGHHHREEACDKMVAGLAKSHPMRAILLHLHGGSGEGTLDAEITSEAHKLVTGFPVQREQVLLHVRGGAADHLSSLVGPLLVPDVLTYLWWSGKGQLSERTALDVMSFCDVLVVDTQLLEHPVDALLQLAELNEDPDEGIGIGDFRWGRLRPVRDAIGQFFAPEDRHPFLGGIREVDIEMAGSGPGSRVSGALIAGWLAASLGWRLEPVASGRGRDVTEASARIRDGQYVRVRLRSTADDGLTHGELLSVRLSGRAGRRPFAVEVERAAERDHAHMTIDLGGEPLQQHLSMSGLDESDLLVRTLWAGRDDPVFGDALRAARPLLQVLRP